MLSKVPNESVLRGRKWLREVSLKAKAHDRALIPRAHCTGRVTPLLSPQAESINSEFRT